MDAPDPTSLRSSKTWYHFIQPRNVIYLFIQKMLSPLSFEERYTVVHSRKAIFPFIHEMSSLPSSKKSLLLVHPGNVIALPIRKHAIHPNSVKSKYHFALFKNHKTTGIVPVESQSSLHFLSDHSIRERQIKAPSLPNSR